MAAFTIITTLIIMALVVLIVVGSKKVQNERDEMKGLLLNYQQYCDDAKKAVSEQREVLLKSQKQYAVLNAEYNKLLTDNNSLMTKYHDSEKRRETLESSLHEIKDNHDVLTSKYRDSEQLRDEINALKDELKTLEKEAIVHASEVFIPNRFKSEELKNKLALRKNKQKEMIQRGDAVTLIDDTYPRSRKDVNDNIKQILRCFNAECDLCFHGITVRNIDSRRGHIVKSYEVLNRLYAVDGVRMTQAYLEEKLNELKLYHDYARQKEFEREFDRELKMQILEEERADREWERRRRWLVDEERHFEKQIEDLEEAKKVAPENKKSSYDEQIRSCKKSLDEVRRDREECENFKRNRRLGYVYVISNVRSFGENVYKIGMSRRPNPEDRVRELGDASVPFPFDIHVKIRSDDAPKLEAHLHQTLSEYKVNKENPRKEFFRVPLSKIERAVNEINNISYRHSGFNYDCESLTNERVF